MIAVKRLNGEEILVNPHLIEIIEATPDTVITLTTGKILVVRENTVEIVEKIIAYRQKLGHPYWAEESIQSKPGDPDA